MVASTRSARMRPARPAGRWRAAWLVAGLALAVSWAAAPAQAAPSTKLVAATVSTSCDAGGSPYQTVYRITLTNDASSNQPFASANITLPTGFTAASAPLPVDAAGWTATLAGGVVQLRSVGTTTGIAPGASLDVEVHATAGTPGTKTWLAQVKQSNNFNGTGNDFTVENAPVSTVVDGTLVFDQQPTVTQAAVPVSPAVSVALRDDCGTLLSGFSDGVRLDYVSGTPANGVTPGPLSGNVASAVAGVATFTRLAVPTTAFGYRLAASAPSATVAVAASAPSDAFDVVSSLTKCTGAAKPCSTTLVTTSPTVQAKVDANPTTAPATTDLVDVTVGGGAAPLSCSLLPADTVTFLVTAARSSTVTLVPTQFLRTTNSGVTKNLDVCYGQATSFTVKGGGGAVLQPSGEYEGVLPECSDVPAGPCVSGRSSAGGTIVITVFVPDGGDPHMTF